MQSVPFILLIGTGICIVAGVIAAVVIVSRPAPPPPPSEIEYTCPDRYTINSIDNTCISTTEYTNDTRDKLVTYALDIRASTEESIDIKYNFRPLASEYGKNIRIESNDLNYLNSQYVTTDNIEMQLPLIKGRGSTRTSYTLIVTQPRGVGKFTVTKKLDATAVKKL